MTPLSPAGLLHDLLVPLRLHLHRRDRGIHAPGPGQRSPLITRVEHCVTASLHYTLLQASYFLFAVSTLMTKTSVCTDPIIYFWLNTQVCKIYWLVASYTMFISISILNLFSQFQFRKELLSLTGRLEREPSQSMTGISLTSFYTRPIIRSAGQSEDRNNTSQKV